MSVRFQVSSAQYAYNTSYPDDGGEPVSLSCWCKAASNTINNQNLVYWARSGGPAGYVIKFGWQSVLARAANDDWSSQTSSYSIAFPTNTWLHVGGLFTSTTSRHVVYQGVKQSENTTSLASSRTLDRIYVADTASDSGTDVHVAEVGVWKAALDDAEWAALGAGVSPALIRPDALLSYYPLRQASLLEDRFGGYTLTSSGSPTTDTHCRVFLPSRPAIITPSAAAPGGDGTDFPWDTSLLQPQHPRYQPVPY